MKSLKVNSLAKIFLMVLLMSFMFFSKVFASDSTDSLQTQHAEFLKKLNVIQGYPDGSLKLGNNIKRSEYITLVVRASNSESTDTTGYVANFVDLKSSHWAYKNLKVALKTGLVSGYTDKTIRPDKNVTYAEALTVILNYLGYKNLPGKWPTNVIDKATSLGITKNSNLVQDKVLTRGEMCTTLYNALLVKFAD